VTTTTFRRLAAMGIALGARVRFALRLPVSARHGGDSADPLLIDDAGADRDEEPTPALTLRSEGGWSLDLSDDD
jgi:hypothetical protein